MRLWWCPFIQGRTYMNSKFTGKFCVMTLKNMIQNLKRNWLVSSKLTWVIWQILTQVQENLKNLHFSRLLLTKVYNVWAKKSLDELFFMALNIDQKFWTKTDLCFEKWQREYRKFSLEHIQKSKNWGFDGLDPFMQSRKCMSLKSTVEFCIMKWNWRGKLKRNWLVSWKLSWGIWQILTQALKNLKNLDFSRLLLTKVYNVWAKKRK